MENLNTKTYKNYTKCLQSYKRECKMNTSIHPFLSLDYCILNVFEYLILIMRYIPQLNIASTELRAPLSTQFTL